MPPRTRTKAKTLEDYWTALPPIQRATLEKVRRSIKAAAPGAEECISYGLPAFRLAGRALVAIGAAANHCSFFPMSSATIAALREELRDYETSVGTIRFPVDRPLSAALIRKLVKARISENSQKRRRK